MNYHEKANAAWAGWVAATGGPPPNENALLLFMAQAMFETELGEAWSDPVGVPSRCWGACDLRALSAAEKEAFADGSLRIGAFLYPDGSWSVMHKPGAIGTLRGDSDPNSGAFKVWFAVFDTDAQGASYMLRAGVRQARAALIDPECSSFTYSKDLYVMCCYYGGTTAGARPCGHRPDPPNDAEVKNITKYANAIDRNLPSLRLGLANWTPPGPYGQVNDVFVGHADTPNLGDEIAQARVAEDEEAETVALSEPSAWHRRNPDPIG